ncbi:hypothetical protein B6S44_16665 [Bosea sp. Tri-44]|uniref:CHAP domain-containing protein n=1 Tax=Bosea sp. Tri-44 TaxID=1972137 RepID=UPI00100FCC57|nr:CHAP domain-containing protein [Bosea sp. Tri-44]RXT52412.1 hypothetical protein B6S44_16665 [Bosea sp. Tri-44]
MISRRLVAKSSWLLPMILASGNRVFAQSSSIEPPPVQFPAGLRVPTVEEYAEELDQVTGKESPYRQEVERGKKLLEDIPKGATPYATADRFRQWREGKVGETDEERRLYSYYAREWPVRGNPVIMGFFDATGFRKPAGDTTYWCAAFVSWIIERSRIGKGDASRIWPYQTGAASSAYRSHFNKISDEGTVRRGDLAVFQNKAESWAGHVGFVHDVDLDQNGKARAIWVLGGNQGAQNDYNGGEVNISKFNRSSSRLEFNSFRTHEILHG